MDTFSVVIPEVQDRWDFAFGERFAAGAAAGVVFYPVLLGYVGVTGAFCVKDQDSSCVVESLGIPFGVVFGH